MHMTGDDNCVNLVLISISQSSIRAIGKALVIAVVLSLFVLFLGVVVNHPGFIAIVALVVFFITLASAVSDANASLNC